MLTRSLIRTIPRSSTLSPIRFTAQPFSTTFKTNMKVQPVQVSWSDNWMYQISDDASGEAAVVDPWDYETIGKKAKADGVKVTQVITTHHHNDHSGGNADFVKAHPGIPVYGGSNKGQAVDTLVKDGDTFKIGKNINVKALHTPCHTQDSTCFYLEDPTTNQRGVLTGDTLFLAGCGRFFEGTPTEMHAALTKLGGLPDDTVVYNGHEYTSASAKFGLKIEPDNKDLQGLADRASSDSCTTGKSTIGDEKKWNVFMRLDTPEAQRATGETEAVKVMAALREMKNKG